MYLNHNYFISEPTLIAGLESSSFDGLGELATDLRNRIERYIQIYEPIYLSALLGNDYQNLIEADAALKALIFDEDSFISPCAKFVWFKYVSENSTENTASGSKVIKMPNSDSVVNAKKLISVWNQMVDESGNILIKSENESLYPDFENSIFYQIDNSSL